MDNATHDTPDLRRSSRKKCSVVMVTAPKGGVCKTTIARAVLVSASLAGLKVLGLDFDEQSSLSDWGKARERTRIEYPDISHVEVRQAALGDWRSAMTQTAPFDLAVIDTPPGVGANIPALRGIMEKTDYCIVPTGSSDDDLNKVQDWGRSLASFGVNFSFCLSKVNSRTRKFEFARSKLLRCGTVMALHIPLLEAIPADAGAGLTVLDWATPKPKEGFEDLWQVTRREIDR